MSILKRDLSIALLLGGPGAEREVSLVSGSSVYDALVRAGFTNVTRVDLQGPDFRLPEGTELAYNIIHGHLRGGRRAPVHSGRTRHPVHRRRLPFQRRLL